MPDDLHEDLIQSLLPTHGEAIDPVELARRDLIKKLPKRFYKTAQAVETHGLFGLMLDGKPARTPAGQPLAVANKNVAEAVAAEWAAQGEYIEPGLMPLTRMLNSALDGVAREIPAVQAEIIKYAGSDLLCYRAGDPANLVAEQAAAWDPILAWARNSLDLRFVLAEGVMFVEQPPETLARVGELVGIHTDPIKLSGLHVMTSLMGSTLLALAVAHQQLSTDQAWAAAHVDEDFQMRAWGTDAEAVARRARRWADMQAAALLALA